jgi:hypothetical protein
MAAKVKNETLKKLTHEEINNLGLFDIGVVCVKGIAKARVKGYKTTLKSETEMHYTNEEKNFRVELIKSADEEFTGWSFRYYDMAKEKYEFVYLPMIACEFVKPE